jgi:hypothetical protein
MQRNISGSQAHLEAICAAIGEILWALNLLPDRQKGARGLPSDGARDRDDLDWASGVVHLQHAADAVRRWQRRGLTWVQLSTRAFY